MKKEELFNVAVLMVGKIGYPMLTRDSLCKEANIAAGMLNKWFGTMANFKDELLLLSIKAINEGTGENKEAHARIILSGKASGKKVPDTVLMVVIAILSDTY